MKIRVKVEGKECLYCVRSMAINPYKDYWEVLARVVEDSSNFPMEEKLLILAKGTKKSMEEMLEIIKQSGISSHRQYLDILNKVT